MPTPLVALFDVGKTNAKLSLIDPQSGEELWSARRASAIVHNKPFRELDISGIEHWLLDALRSAPHKDRIATIVPVAHGAAAVLLDEDQEVIAAPDYEDPCYEVERKQYARERDDYSRTFSPNLPLGLNLARQWFFLQRAYPNLFNRTAHLLLYPQYWAWRLSGVMSTEVTSLGCHTDLWLAQEKDFSSLTRKYGWEKLLPPLRFAGDMMGTITPALATASGLDSRCAVACGIHDSNASYLRFLIGREHEPFTVVSSGTWTIVMTNRGDLSRLTEQRDMLANVDAFGSPVATARFMGGREYEMIAHAGDVATLSALAEVIRSGAMALPSFACAGPFSGCKGRLVAAEGLSGDQRAALATLYSALMTSLLIESLGASGDILIDGPLAKNPFFGSLLASLDPQSSVKLQTTEAGGALAAAYLSGLKAPHAEPAQTLEPLAIPGIAAYRERWRETALRGDGVIR